MHKFIRGVLKDMYGAEVADMVPLLYGGSVKPDNVKGLYEKENIDGALVGGACLKADSFLVNYTCVVLKTLHEALYGFFNHFFNSLIWNIVCSACRYYSSPIG